MGLTGGGLDAPERRLGLPCKITTGFYGADDLHLGVCESKQTASPSPSAASWDTLNRGVFLLVFMASYTVRYRETFGGRSTSMPFREKNTSLPSAFRRACTETTPSVPLTGPSSPLSANAQVLLGITAVLLLKSPCLHAQHKSDRVTPSHLVYFTV